MAVEPPPIQEKTTDDRGVFPRVWVNWFQDVYDCFVGILARLDLIETRTLGWVYYKDTQYTEASPLNVNDERTQLTINGLASTTVTAYSPAIGELWDTSTSSIMMDNVGEAFVIRLDWKAKATNQNAYYNLELDIGDGGSIVITSRTYQMIHGVGVEELFSDTISGFALSTFIANGCKIYLNTMESGDEISFYDFAIKVEKTFTP